MKAVKPVVEQAIDAAKPVVQQGIQVATPVIQVGGRERRGPCCPSIQMGRVGERLGHTGSEACCR